MAKKIDLLEELGVGGKKQPQEFGLKEASLLVKQSYTGEEVLEFQTAWGNTDADIVEYIGSLIHSLSADTKENEEKFIAELNDLTVAAAFRVIANIAIHVGLMDADGVLQLGCAKR